MHNRGRKLNPTAKERTLRVVQRTDEEGPEEDGPLRELKEIRQNIEQAVACINAALYVLSKRVGNAAGSQQT